MDILVGYTGFVGSNIAQAHKFDGMYNSKNITEAYGLNPDLLVYSGVPAAKYLANQAPEKDKRIMEEALLNIQKIGPRKLVLISTVDVYDTPVNHDEDHQIQTENLHPYGFNRYLLEQWVQNEAMDSTILRLPALFGDNLKKNFIYDLIHLTPFMLTEDKFLELTSIDNFIKKYYKKQENGFYQCQNSSVCKPYFKEIGFNALNFTDSRNSYQFYSLENIWKDIVFCINHEINLCNITSEPVTASELYSFLYNSPFKNECLQEPLSYNLKSKHAKSGYFYDKQAVLEKIKSFVEDQSQ